MTILQSLFGPVFPPDVFVFSDGAVTYYRFVRSGRDRWRLVAAKETPLSEEAWPRQPLGRLAVDPKDIGEVVENARLLAGGELRRASVVVPDGWTRSFLLDFEQLASSPKEVDEMVSWKLRKLLPFRPEDFRFVWSQLGGGKRVFAVGMLEKVAAAIEGAFEAKGVRIGSIEGASFSLAALAGPEAGDSLLLSADPAAFHLLVMRGGVPSLYRSRRFVVDAGEAEERGTLLRREVDLTRAFLSANGGVVPEKALVWEDPAGEELDLVGLAGDLFASGASKLKFPAEIEVDAGISAHLRRRALLAVGAAVGREAS